ncbi:lipoprotein, putative [Sporocytophaga myxococcoides]|uniref:Lipoprotein, putative n=1 Tax=Sporocytophaga myxococcoides TaxID=153721 RepID=A0A098LDC7_9BACT|nr:DUF4349 domain-containing protein [Sporocytophaga myxococcoides]GAL84941.1 lipoprotein, putative [Sporocytophaga myxococcoides]
MKRIIAISLFFVNIFSSCAQKEEKAEASDIANQSQEVVSIDVRKDSRIKAPGKIIRKANIKFETKDLQKTTAELEFQVNQLNGFMESSELLTGNYEHSYKMILRVPASAFDTMIRILSKEALFMNEKTITSEDVSEEFVDVTSRLKSKREVEQRYIELLRNNAKTLEEVLLAEQQIASLHEEIEAKVDRLNYLKDQVSYSTIAVKFYQKIEYVPEPDMTEVGMLVRFKEAFSSGWDGVMSLAIGLTYIWPLLVIIGAAVLFIINRKRMV